jgi:penicillin-binding protein 2
VRDATEPNEFGVTIDKQNFKTVKEGMRLVVEGDHGTARRARIKGIVVGGKTGTTQVRSFSADEIYKRCDSRPFALRHHGWFVGYAPLVHPEITVAVLAQHSCSGAVGSAPVVHDIMQAYFEKYHPEMLKAAENEKDMKQVSVKTPVSVEEGDE